MSKNGVLFDKEKKTIYRYPSSKSGKTYNVPKSVELIVSGAFEGCRNLQTVNFNKDSTALIDGLAFYNCFKIKTMTFPKKIRLLDDGNPPIGFYFVGDDEYDGRIDKQVDGFSVRGYKNSSAEWICSVYCFKFTSLCKDGKEHKTVKRKAKKATYFEDGNKAYEFCTVCGEWINYRKIPRLRLAYPRLIEIKGEKSAIKVKCNAGKDATGFQVRYFNEDGKKVTKTFSSDGAKTVRIKGLKSGEYRVRVRGFVKSGKKVAYSSWSYSKYITVK